MGFWENGETILVYNKYQWLRSGEGEWKTIQYTVRDGFLRKSESAGRDYDHDFCDCYKKRIAEWFTKNGYFPYPKFTAKFVVGILEPCINQPIEAAEDNIRLRTEMMNKKKKQDQEMHEKNMDLHERFGGYVIGIAGDYSVYSTGFSIRVLLSTGRSFKERSRFVRDNWADLIAWVMEEIPNKKRLVKTIGDIHFYKPSEVTILRNPEIEIKFDIKNPALLTKDSQ